MNSTGSNLIGYEESSEVPDSFRGIDPQSNSPFGVHFCEASEREIDRAVHLADACFSQFRDFLAERRADFLIKLTEEVLALGDEFLEIASKESAYSIERCAIERDRVVDQAILFSDLLREGSWVDARIDFGSSQNTPEPDVRSLLQPVGPVAVFGASNFPIAISVLGADTISALASGCPVIFKSHPAHPNTSEMAARALLSAAKRMKMPEGIFSLLHGEGHRVGTRLVEHPQLAAVAFTGSLQGGRALMDIAAARPHPIPFYAEMGSLNPVFFLPSALKETENREALADAFVKALTQGVGQFCTNPGMAVGIQSDEWDDFSKIVGQKVAEIPPASMLHEGIHAAYVMGLDAREENEDLMVLGASEHAPDPTANEAATLVYETTQQGIVNDPTLLDELFGPTSTLVSCGKLDDMVAIAHRVEGSLTASIHGSEEEMKQYKPLLKVLQRKAGRLVFNGFPVGLAVNHSLHHGGPYPATSHSFFTSVGTRCIQRFVRPVCYQNCPNSLLPLALQNENPRGVWRLINGRRTRDEL